MMIWASRKLRPAKCAAMSKWCWLLSLTPAVWYTMSMFHTVKQSPKSTTRMSSVAYIMLCGATRQCFSIFPTLHSENQTSVVHQAPYSPYNFWWVPKLKRLLKGKQFQTKGHYDCFDSRAKHHPRRSFLKMFPIMGALLGKVCDVPRRLLWGWLGFQRSRYACFFFPLPEVRILF